jgi:glycerate kinase
MVGRLDNNLRHYANVIKEQLGTDILDAQGAGAAGGAGAALMAFCGARFASGIQTVLDVTGFDRHLETADLVITGEGNLDGQSAYGKVPAGIGARARRYHVPVVALGGGLSKDAGALYACGIDGMMSIVDRPMPLREAMETAEELLENAAERVMRVIKTGMRLHAAAPHHDEGER